MLSLKEITLEYVESLNYIDKVIEREFSLPETRDIVAVIGPRRVGKTFLLLQKAKALHDSGKNVIFVSFDEPLLRKLPVRKFAELVRYAYPEGRVYLFLDEIQEWRNWDYNLRWLHDVKDFNIYISGSSSTLQSSEIPSRLRGRHIAKLVLPISFREIVNFEIKTFRERGKVKHLLDNYLKWGGFPEIWLERNRDKIVSILETAFYRDIIERQRIRELRAFEEFFYFVLSYFGNPFSYRSLKKALENYGLKLDTKTVIKYFNAMKQAFLVFDVPRFCYSEKEKLRSYRKLYIVDSSFAQLFYQGLNKSRIVENIVYLELLRRYGQKEIYYYLTGSSNEIDFYVPREKLLIETSLEPSNEHINKLLEAMRELKIKTAYLISWDLEDVIKKENYAIKIIPLWKWLLNFYHI